MGEPPLFYAAARKVYIRPRRHTEGSRTVVSMGFPVCELTMCAEDSAATAIVEALNEQAGTPEPWRRTPAQQVQDLHLEVDRLITERRSRAGREAHLEAALRKILATAQDRALAGSIAKHLIADAAKAALEERSR